ncbi:MAG: glucose-6-phosphate isomerase [Actinomycetota bacterium]
MITVTGSGLSTATSATKTSLNAITVALAAKDHTLWGKDAESEAIIRLNWIDLPISSRALLPELDALVAWSTSKSISTIVLAGMGGSSLAPEVIAKTFQKKLIVLDTTDPDQIKAAIPTDLAHSLVVVGSKSGSTIETASHKALFTKLFLDAGLNPVDHFVIVTDPGSPLDKSARADGLRVINADPNVGGRYSALSAFGLVPAALIGVDVSILIDDAAAIAKTFVEPDSAAVTLAAALFDKNEQSVAFFDTDSDLPGLSDWIEQLIAESTGKNQTGRLPVVIESNQAPTAGSALRVGFKEGTNADLIVTGSLGEQFILWEWVTALLGYALKVDPFNQPNVTEAKERTGALLSTWGDGKVPKIKASFENDLLAVYSNSSASTLSEQLKTFLANKNYYFAIMAYLARGIDDQAPELRELIASKSGKATTFGWGPRFLHSTGQFHKGGQHDGAFLQITGENKVDLAIPNQNFTFHTLLMAQGVRRWSGVRR